MEYHNFMFQTELFRLCVKSDNLDLNRKKYLQL